jgi:hypothetical protein
MQFAAAHQAAAFSRCDQAASLSFPIKDAASAALMVIKAHQPRMDAL